jgi:hypothetical protein
MASAPLAGTLRFIRALASMKQSGEKSDGDLLQQFFARRDDEAFAALFQRHGRLVFGVCRQVLHDPQDAEDAFQATFLVLARKAASVRKLESLAAWLHRVALNISRLVTATPYPTTIQVWDMATRMELHQFASRLKVKDPGGEEYEVPTHLAVAHLAVSPDGRTLATAGWDQTIRLWDVAAGTERRRLEAHRGVVTSLAWSADGNTLASGSNDGTALVWDARDLRKDGKPVR